MNKINLEKCKGFISPGTKQTVHNNGVSVLSGFGCITERGITNHLCAILNQSVAANALLPSFVRPINASFRSFVFFFVVVIVQ